MFLTLISFLPIILLIFLMTKKRPMPSARALPLVAFLTYLAMIFLFGHPLRLVHANVISGFLTAFTPILIIWGAIFLFRTMSATGAMDTLHEWLNTVSPNPVAQLMIAGWAFAFLIEGASGFGTPAALAAPVLVGLGFKPLPVAIMVLTMNTVPVSFGAVGTPTWFGFSTIALTDQEITAIGIKSAVIQGAASLVIPILALRFVIEWPVIRKNIGFIYLSILCTVAPYVLIAFWNYEFPTLAGGITGLLGSVIIASRGLGLEKMHEEKMPKFSHKELIKAGFPLWGTLLLLVITRVPQLGLKDWLNAELPAVNIFWGGLGLFSVSPSLVVGLKDILGTQESWSHKILYVPSLLPFAVIALITFILYRTDGHRIRQVFKSSAVQMKAPALALFGALIFVKLMMMGGEASAVNRIGTAFADVAGGAWYGFASLLGAVGSFFSGSNTISNLTFGPIQNAIALKLGLDRTTVLALQSVGGAMGNMVCINNIVAVCSVLAILNQEGFILKKTARVLIPYALIAAAVAVIFFI
jgi:lactate permease